MIDCRDRARSARGLQAPVSALALVLTIVLAGCAPAPEVSGAAPGAGSATPAYVQHLGPERIDDWRGVHYDGLILDVRTVAEWDDAIDHLDNATHMPVEELQSRLGEIERYRTAAVLVYDTDGMSGTRAGQILVTNGFRDVSVLDGGLKAYRAWQAAR